MALQQRAERRNCARLDQLRHLLLVAANRQIADGPGRLLLCLKLSLRQVLDDLRQKPGIDDRLDLRLNAGGDVGQEPNRLLPDLLFGVTQERRKVCKCVVVEDDLSLLVRSGDDVADGTQRGGLYLHLDMRQQRDQVRNDAAVDDQLDLLVAAVGQVAERPDGVDEDVHVRVVNEMTEGWKDLIDGLDRRRRVLVAAQVDDHPRDVAEEADGDVRFDERQQRLHNVHLDDVISKLRSIADDVAERPDGLLANVGGW